MLSEEGSFRGQIIALGSCPFVGASCMGCDQRKGLGHCHNKQCQKDRNISGVNLSNIFDVLL
jgi:hypothetical protein